LQAAKREQESDQNADDNDAIQTEDESVHDKIKKPMTGQNIHTNRRRNTRRFLSNIIIFG